MRLGVNLGGVSLTGSRPFWNLLAGGHLQFVALNSKGDASAGKFGADGNIISLPDNVCGRWPVGTPAALYEGGTADLIVTWEGTAKVALLAAQGATSNVMAGANSISFTMHNSVTLDIQSIDPNDPPHNFDVRESDAPRDALWYPPFLSDLAGYNILRFMDWAQTNRNRAVTWADRPTATMQQMWRGLGLPLEYMIELANLLNVDPWLCVPWNADESFVRGMAEYVRDNLAPGLVAHVETGNEVWNYKFTVTTQAIREGRERGLATDDVRARLRRYAQRATEIFTVFKDVFHTEMERINRIAAFQNGDVWGATISLDFEGFADHIDTIASAPYFALNLTKGRVAELGLDTIFERIPLTIDATLSSAAALRDLAIKRGKRYATYESGQHILSPDDVPQLVIVERDPRMGDMYRLYLDRWKAEFSDDLVLFNDATTITKYGAWGHREYTGQPLDAAPKAKGIEEWRLANLAPPPVPEEPEKTKLEQALDDLDAAVAAVREAAK